MNTWRVTKLKIIIQVKGDLMFSIDSKQTVKRLLFQKTYKNV